MKKYTNKLLAIFTSLMIVGCSVGPSVIKGTVIMRTPTEAHINLGSDDGVQVGDTLTVWRDENRATSSTRLVRAGKIRVLRVIDRSYSAVEVLQGTVYEHDTVEKKMR
jgi:hypothetical protein